MVWAGAEEIGDQLQADVLFATAEVGHAVFGGEWGVEGVAAAEVTPHPGAAVGGGHQHRENAIVEGTVGAGALLGGADHASVTGVVVGHGAAPVSLVISEP